MIRYASLRRSVRAALDALSTDWRCKRATATYEWELEVRIGAVRRRAPPPPATLFDQSGECLLPVQDRVAKFDTTIDAEQFLAAFEALARNAVAERTSVTPTAVDYVQHGDGGRRTTHQLPTHVGCTQREKRPIRPHCDLERSCDVTCSLAFDVRIAACVEMPAPPPPTPCADAVGVVKRERRSVVLRAAHLWRIDFTRLDDGRAHQIEIELLWPLAYEAASKAHRALTTRVDFHEFLAHVLIEQLIVVLDRLHALTSRL